MRGCCWSLSNHVEDVPVFGAAEGQPVFVFDVELKNVWPVQELPCFDLGHVRLALSIGPESRSPNRSTARIASGINARVIVLHVV